MGARTVDWNQKLAYLKLNGFQGLLKFCENSVINEIDD